MSTYTLPSTGGAVLFDRHAALPAPDSLFHRRVHAAGFYHSLAISGAWSLSDIDEDGVPDIYDVCPADPEDQCNVDGSAAEPISAEDGGTLETPDGALTLEVDSGDLGEDVTLSVTQTVRTDPEVDLTVGANPGIGQAAAVYDLEPDGLAFDNPVTITISADVSSLNESQRNNLSLYLWTDTDADGVEDTFVAVENASCLIVEDPVGVFTSICSAELSHFSSYALVAPLDSDGDGVFDAFNGVVDACPQSDLSPTIVIKGEDTGVENELLSDGCTLTDLIAQTLSVDPAKSDTVHLLVDFKAGGLITG